MLARLKLLRVSILPITAHLAVGAWPRGYKYFDYIREVVIVDANRDVDFAEFKQYLRLLEIVGKETLGPAIVDIDESRRIYTETMVFGFKIDSVLAEESRVLNGVEKFIHSLWQCGEYEFINVARHVEVLEREVFALLKIIRVDAPDVYVGVIETCVRRCLRNLRNKSDVELVSGISHGDFRERNLLWVNDRVIAIDWTTIAIRSRMFDVLSLVLSIVRRSCDHSERLPSQERERLLGLLESLLSSDREHRENGAGRIPCRETVFSVFLLEFVIVKLKYFVVPQEDGESLSNDRLTQLVEYIEASGYLETLFTGNESLDRERRVSELGSA